MPRPRASARVQYPISATSPVSFHIAPIEPTTPPSAVATANRDSRGAPVSPRMYASASSTVYGCGIRSSQRRDLRVAVEAGREGGRVLRRARGGGLTVPSVSFFRREGAHAAIRYEALRAGGGAAPFSSRSPAEGAGQPMTTTDLRGGQDLSQHGLAPTGRVIWHPTTALLYEHALVRGDGRLAEGGPLVVDTGKHTGRSPKDKFVVREPGSEGRIWWDGNNEINEREVRAAAREDRRAPRAGAGAVRRRLVRRRRPEAPHRRPRRHRPPVPRALREDALHRPDRRRARGLRAGRARAARARGRRRARRGRDTHRDLRRAAPGPHRAARRRHLLRRRDQEVDLHRPQRPAPARGRPADALLGERLPRRRQRRDLLRPLRHRQDDALGRAVADADRRRRARLGRQRRLQLRGRLLREDDPALADRRAGDLEGVAQLRDDPRERRDRRAAA